MLWIYFDRDEPPAPSIKLPTLTGEMLEPSDFRGVSSLVLFFAHGLGCFACSALVQELAGATEGLRAQEAQALVILPEAPAQSLPGRSRLHFLVDRQGLLRRAYASIFEFDVRNQAMLFILDQYGAPFRAWVGDGQDTGHDLSRVSGIVPQMLKYLESAALLCPE